MKLEPLLTQKLKTAQGYDLIQGWTGEQALSVIANASDNAVRIPGEMKPHSVAAHPSPTLAAMLAWKSPVAGNVSVHGSLQDAHPECGNGVTWSLEIRRGIAREALVSGATAGAKLVNIDRIENVHVLPGDVIAIVIGPREGNHVCDLTATELVLSNGQQKWSLTEDISDHILAGNPHADRYGNRDVWHFLSEPASIDAAPTVPDGSWLSMWRKSKDLAERDQLARRLQDLLEHGLSPAEEALPNRMLYNQILSFNGPFLLPSLSGASSRAVKSVKSGFIDLGFSCLQTM